MRLLVCGVLLVAACSDEQHTSNTSTSAVSPVQDPATLPLVDQVVAAATAVEATFGAPQRFFEINATSQLVNVIVALNDGALAQAFVYLGGEVSSTEPRPAQGNTFAASALTFDPGLVLAQVRTELPGSSIDLFVVEGGAGGLVRYTAVVTSAAGGQLLVVVDPAGRVLSVEPG